MDCYYEDTDNHQSLLCFLQWWSWQLIFHSDDHENNIFYISSLINCSGPPHPRLIPGKDNDDDNDDDDIDNDDDNGDNGYNYDMMMTMMMMMMVMMMAIMLMVMGMV